MNKTIKYLKFFLTLFLLILFTNKSLAQDICGVITENTTWTKASSPYHITCNSALQEGKTLTVEAGVEIYIDEDVVFNVDGTLNFNGIEGDSIYIQSNGTGNFTSINVRVTGKITANYVKIKEAQTAINLESTTEECIVKNSVIESCYRAFYQEDESSANTSFSNVLIQNNNSGYSNNSDNYNYSISITNCVFSNNTINAIYLNTQASYGNYIIQKCQFMENETAINIYDFNKLTILDSDFSQNTTAIETNYSNSINIKNNSFSDNNIGLNLYNGSGNATFNLFSNNDVGIQTRSTNFIANYNDFSTNTQYSIKATLQEQETFDARFNNFNTINETEIQASIYDYYDDVSLMTIDYSGFAILSPPMDFKANLVDYTKVQLNWQDNTDNETKYEIYRGVNNNTSFDLLNSLEANANSYLDNTVEAGNTYYYKVYAVNAIGSSPEIDTLAVVDDYFTELKSVSLFAGFNGDAEWGDFDKDGDFDILLSGDYSTYIYTNNGDCSFERQNSIGLSRSWSFAWGDYDNDDDLDILLTGYNSTEGTYTKIYKNIGNGNFLEQTNISLAGVYISSIDWGDYDNDGDLDILLTGDDGSYNEISKIYKNNGDNTFSEQTGISLTGVRYSSVAWGDYNNDNYLDILLTGSGENGSISKIYKNNGNGDFKEQTNIPLKAVNGGSAAWGDYNNDNYLDILLTGSGGVRQISLLI